MDRETQGRIIRQGKGRAYVLPVFTVESSAGNVPLENTNLLVTPNKLATFKTTSWHAEPIGDMTSGRHGIHSGKHSILSMDGAKSDNTARQKINLQ